MWGGVGTPRGEQRGLHVGRGRLHTGRSVDFTWGGAGFHIRRNKDSTWGGEGTPSHACTQMTTF